MTGVALVFLAATGVVAAADWAAVLKSARRVEYAAKPAVMIGLIAVALAVHPVSSAERAFFVIALALGLASDVFLMLPRAMFVAGPGGRAGRTPGLHRRFSAVFVVMVASAGGSGSLVALAGAVLFFYSDAILAWNRFVKPIPLGRNINIVPYHAREALLVLSLVT